MDVYQILMQDHRLTEQIFADLESTTTAELERRERLFEILRKGLEDHSVVEEEIFYPEIYKLSPTKELVADAFDKHAEFDAILQEIGELSTNKDEWLERICELRELVQEHIRKEEDRIFPAARRLLEETRAVELGRQIGRRKAETARSVIGPQGRD
jgi:iron-sulfur cluster repair protein YtfE (RIC family)